MKQQEKERGEPLSNYKRSYIQLKDISPTKSDIAILKYIRAISNNNSGILTHYIYQIAIKNSPELANVYIAASAVNKAVTSKIVDALEQDKPFHLAEVSFINLCIWQYSYLKNGKNIVGIKGTADSVKLEV